MSTDSVSDVFFILQSDEKTTRCKLFVDHVFKIIANKVKNLSKLPLTQLDEQNGCDILILSRNR